MHACMHAVARNNGQLQYYHTGIYGSKHTAMWSCCHKRSRNDDGCMRASAETLETSWRGNTSSTCSLASSTGDTASPQSSSSCSSLYVYTCNIAVCVIMNSYCSSEPMKWIRNHINFPICYHLVSTCMNMAGHEQVYSIALYNTIEGMHDQIYTSVYSK